MNPLANKYICVALGAVLASYVAPTIINKFVRVEVTPLDEKINAAASAGIVGGVTMFSFVLLGMLGGESFAAAAKA